MERVLEGTDAILARQAVGFLIDSFATASGAVVHPGVAIRFVQLPMPPVILDDEVVIQFGCMSVALQGPKVVRAFLGKPVELLGQTLTFNGAFPHITRLRDGLRLKWEHPPLCDVMWGLAKASIQVVELYRDQAVIRAEHRFGDAVVTVLW